eukprot:TRINITY_DN20229_c0_g6_i1.p1 TRINITY_DN20229_c0_g6~~TRINITY_DN20229_c0_g6_i1.p1  ORF type:complete len:621 (+),score=110.90 TRINITY_DN20229_c0_g6_i1:25-1863(+)
MHFLRRLRCGPNRLLQLEERVAKLERELKEQKAWRAAAEPQLARLSESAAASEGARSGAPCGSRNAQFQEDFIADEERPAFRPQRVGGKGGGASAPTCTTNPSVSEIEVEDCEDEFDSYRLRDPPSKRPTVGELLDLLRQSGGVASAPDSAQNSSFLAHIDVTFPELEWYRGGRVQTSPGVEEIAGSPTEYYRTVGAIIAVLSVYSTSKVSEQFGIDAVSAGDRGPMSVDQVPGKFLNLGNNPSKYVSFCSEFSNLMLTEDDWWAMVTLLAIHDCGKSEDFRARVNATLSVELRSDDHDRILARALANPELVKSLLPSVAALPARYQQIFASGFNTNFQLPQLGQGEVAVINLRGLLKLPAERLTDGSFLLYLYHSIFDIAGSTCTEKFIYPLALDPVYVGFASAMEELIGKLRTNDYTHELQLYFDFLYSNLSKSFPDFVKDVFQALCEDEHFRNEAGFVFLRILAMTRYTYKNPRALLEALRSPAMKVLRKEMAGSTGGPQTMLYYGPDMLRMGLGTGDNLVDSTGENIKHALRALRSVYTVARQALQFIPTTWEYQFQVNVAPAVKEIKAVGANWTGADMLEDLCASVTVHANEWLTEAIVVLPQREAP